MTPDERATARDAFANAALIGWRARPAPGKTIAALSAAEVAALAYGDADAMLAERERAPE